VGTFDGTTVRFNVNGVPISSAAVAAYHPQTTKALAIGQGEPGSGFFFPGVIDELVDAALAANVPFRAIVADCLYGENPTFEGALSADGLPFVLGLRPSKGVWAPIDAAHTPQEAAQALAWTSPEEPGDWTKVERTFRDGHPEIWWAADLRLGSYGPNKAFRVIVATTDPATLPDLTT
jgi:DDE superfamily endonuclease/Concanavalin A-like lectin/glucanases superfamily